MITLVLFIPVCTFLSLSHKAGKYNIYECMKNDLYFIVSPLEFSKLHGL